MIDLVFWSFVVPSLPISLAVASRVLAFVVGPPAPLPSCWPAQPCPAPHRATRRLSQPGGSGHGR